ncbi:hypothetical protein, partial [Salmonella sp. s29873]|uniref:hypothetical protein n=1 Tax=Salmonella sp. s29873 TaxID=3159634 RepID=UPI00397F9761
VKLRVTCAGTKRGARYRVERRSGVTSGQALWSEEATAEGDRIAKELTVEAERVSRFHCVAL